MSLVFKSRRIFSIHVLLLANPFSLCSLQALLFLLSGIVVMTGSMALIVLDWVHNAPGGGHSPPPRKLHNSPFDASVESTALNYYEISPDVFSFTSF